jgi:hypothetical protein
LAKLYGDCDPMSDEISVKLTIISDSMTASQIDEYIGIKCSDSQERGALNRLGTKRYEHHVWFLKTRHSVSPDAYIGDKIAMQIEQFLSEIRGAADKIKALSRNNAVVFGLYLYTQSVPPLGLSKEQMEAVAALGANLDIDVMLFGKPEITDDEGKEQVIRTS